MTIGPTGAWAVVYGGASRGYYTSGVPSTFFSRLKRLVEDGNSVRQLALGASDSWAIVANENICYLSGVPAALTTAVTTIQMSNLRINAIALGRSGSYAVIYKNNAWYASATRKR